MAIFNQALLVGLIGFALPVMMIEGPVNAVVFLALFTLLKWLTIIYGGLMAGLVGRNDSLFGV